MENLKHTTNVKSLIHGEVSMGTYGLVELEVRELERTKNDLLEALIDLLSELEDVSLPTSINETIKNCNNAINKATK
jgi:hypothetical protein